MSSTAFLHELFMAEKETHLRTLVAELQVLKSGNFDRHTVERMFRAAHSLKGAARLVQELHIEAVAHHLEEELSLLQSTLTVDEHLYNRLVEKIQSLGGKEELVTAEILQSLPESYATHSADLLYISSEHASELITAASELSFVTRRLESTIADGVGSPRAQSELQQLQAARNLSETLQRLCYRLRLTPIREIAPRLRSLAENLGPKLGKRVQFKLANGDTLVDRDSLKALECCFIQLVKNAVDHGIETEDERRRVGKPDCGTLILTARQRGAVVEIDITDDGAGVDLDALRSQIASRGYHTPEVAQALSTEELLEFLFVPGFSTRDTASEVSGRGIGLDIVKATLTSLQGDVRARTVPGRGTTFQLRFPSRLASFRAVMFRVAGARIAIPLTSLKRLINISDISVRTFDGMHSFCFEDEDLPLLDAADVLQLGPSHLKTPQETNPIVILESDGRKVALRVDRFDGEREIVVQTLDRRYKEFDKVLGVAIADEGQLISVLNPDELVPHALRASPRTTTAPVSEPRQFEQKRILVVDDSLTVRELERRLLTQAGFECEVAIDGLDGLDKLRSGSFSLIVTDVDMPRMNGFQFIKTVRNDSKFDQVPIVVVSYKEREQDRSQSIELGAAAFLSKGSFRDESFVTTVRDVLGSNVDS